MSQFKYKFEKYDFKRFLLDSDPDRFKSERFIFWVGKIPLPDDIVFNLFDERGEIVSLYIDHIISMLCLLNTPSSKGGGESALSSYPNPDNPAGISQKALEATYKKHLDKFKAIEQNISEILLLEGYQCNVETITRCLQHEGKKYNRIFLPVAIRDIISTSFKKFDYNSFRAQSDMFGNAIADHYDIYRSGFGDALSGLFNKLIEFLISGYQHNEGEHSNAPGELSIKVSGVSGNDSLVNSKEKNISDGSIWEPAFINNKIGFYLDKELLELVDDSIDLSGLAFQVFSELELSAYSEKERKKFEYIRKDVSRHIKSRLEDKKS